MKLTFAILQCKHHIKKVSFSIILTYLALDLQPNQSFCSYFTCISCFVFFFFFSIGILFPFCFSFAEVEMHCLLGRRKRLAFVKNLSAVTDALDLSALARIFIKLVSNCPLSSEQGRNQMRNFVDLTKSRHILSKKS